MGSVFLRTLGCVKTRWRIFTYVFYQQTFAQVERGRSHERVDSSHLGAVVQVVFLHHGWMEAGI